MSPTTDQRRPAWAEIDLDSLAHNLRFLRSRIGDAKILAIVKADAYGHGAVEVARTVESEGADWLGVALEEEGAELRRAGIELPILVLGVVERAQVPRMLHHRLTPAVSSLEQLSSWAATAQSRSGEEGTLIHLKLDTGMHRLGLAEEEWPRATEILSSTPRLRLTGLLSHLASSEDLESPITAVQETCFDRALALFSALVDEGGILAHTANSAAALHHQESVHSLVRCGLALYGVDPAQVEEGLRPVMQVRARIVETREVEAGAAVGYGGTWIAPRPSRLGVVALGYADGYPWRLSNLSHANSRDQELAVVGAVNMDMLLLDLTGTSVSVGTEVCLMGNGPSTGPGASELAGLAGMSTYELLAHFGLRLPKRYLRAGEEVGVVSRLEPSTRE